MKEHTTQKLADLIAERHLCLSQLRDLGLKQAELISASEMGELLRLIAAKNQLIVALQAIERELTPYHAQIAENRQWSSPEARAKSSSLAAECSRVLEEVMHLERDNEENMTLRRDQVAGQLQAAQATSAARGAYQAQQQLRGPHTRPPYPSLSPNTLNSNSRLDIHSEA